MSSAAFYSTLNRNVYSTTLPGPTRKRQPSSYLYSLTFHTEEQDEAGCVMMWDVDGGRDVYQIALERQENGELRWHCTCADAIYRGEREGHLCKHVRGLLSVGRPTEERRPCEAA